MQITVSFLSAFVKQRLLADVIVSVNLYRNGRCVPQWYLCIAGFSVKNASEKLKIAIRSFTKPLAQKRNGVF